MRTKILLFLVAANLTTASICHAWITDITYQSTSTNLTTWGPVIYNSDNTVGTLDMGGAQFGSATVAGTISASSPDDPSFTVSSSISNDTGFSWSGYKVTVYLDRTFTLSGVSVGPAPAGWSFTTTAPAANPTPVYFGAGEYVAEIDYSGGPPVNNGDLFDFAYTLNFGGSSSYHYAVDMTPIAVPEPSVVALAGMGLLGCAGLYRRLRASR